MKVFVLTNGCYSDTRIVGVYSTRVNAGLAAAIFHDDASIDEYDLDAMADEMRQGYWLYFVRLHRDSGNVLEIHRDDSSYGAFSDAVGEDIQKNLYTHVWAPNDEHATKIAGDRRRMFLAGVAQ